MYDRLSRAQLSAIAGNDKYVMLVLERLLKNTQKLSPPFPGVPEAPSDDVLYARKNAVWEEVAIDADAFVPYTGATANLDLGAFVLESANFRNLDAETSGVDNLFIGTGVAPSNTGTRNVALGDGVGLTLTTGSNNTLLGCQTGAALLDQSGSVFIGNAAGKYESLGNQLMIDAIDRGSETLGRQGAIIYGYFNATPMSQAISFNVGYFWIGANNTNVYFGSAAQALMKYDGTNFTLNPKNAGSGFFDVLGDIQTDGYKAADGTAGATAVAGNFTYKNGLYTEGTAPKITVSGSAPGGPAEGDLWVDTSS